MSSDSNRYMLRHTVATLAYRGGKAILNVPDGFETFRVSETSRSPGEILAHICDLFDWALALAQGKHTWHSSTPRRWEEDVTRFFAALREFDSYLESDSPLGFPAEKLFQGPVADALTHVGQIAMLRRVAKGPVRAENYFKAEIAVGRVGPDQSTTRIEFD